MLAGDGVDLVQEQHGASFGVAGRADGQVAEPLDDVVDRAGEQIDVFGIDRREQRDPELVTAELSVRFDVDHAVGAQRGGDRRRVDRVVEVDRGGHVAPRRRVGHERRRVRVRVGPAVDGAGRRVAATGRELEPAVAEHPLELLVEQEERRERGRVVGLIEAGVLDRDRQVERRRHPPPARVQRLDPLERTRRAQREPEPAVAREALLRREVVDVEGARRPRACRPRADVPSTTTSASESAGRCTGTTTPVEVSLCGYA